MIAPAEVIRFRLRHRRPARRPHRSPPTVIKPPLSRRQSAPMTSPSMNCTPARRITRLSPPARSSSRPSPPARAHRQTAPCTCTPARAARPPTLPTPCASYRTPPTHISQPARRASNSLPRTTRNNPSQNAPRPTSQPHQPHLYHQTSITLRPPNNTERSQLRTANSTPQLTRPPSAGPAAIRPPHAKYCDSAVMEVRSQPTTPRTSAFPGRLQAVKAPSVASSWPGESTPGSASRWRRPPRRGVPAEPAGRASVSTRIRRDRHWAVSPPARNRPPFRSGKWPVQRIKARPEPPSLRGRICP